MINRLVYALGMSSQFGTYMRTLRKQKGLTLKQVEKAAQVSNAYVSQIERGVRNPPHPDILNRLAKVYEVPARELLVAAGYLTEDGEMAKKQKIEQAYKHVTSDPQYNHGTRLKAASLSLEAKRFIVEMYEKMTGRKLLEGV
jgi:transcriptional regulator with XRE-family HTH domain